jgi:ribose-phosphate pyrophosphokinase
MKLMSGNSNPPLVQAIAQYLEMPITQASVRRFADEEIFVEINENVRARTCSWSSRPPIRPTTI